MSEKKRKIIVFMTLPLALIWATYNFMAHDAKPKAPDVAASPPPITGSPTTNTPAKLINIADYESKPWGNDPFRIPAAIQVERTVPVNWVLTGIVYNASNPLAVINKQTVRTGHVINKATVVEIKQDEVILKKDGNLITLRVTKG